MKKKYISVIIVFLVAQGLCNYLYAQTPAWNGTWKIKDLKFLSGSRYGNALPEQMEITVTKDSLKIKRSYEGNAGSTYTIDELLRLDGQPTVRNNTGSSERKASYERKSVNASFVLTVSYRHPSTGEQTSANFTEAWSLRNGGTELLLEKKAINSDGTTWEVSGAYERITSDDLGMDAARSSRFTEGLNWAQVKAKAKREKKFIFVDAYATWCKPCKEMDRLVFPVNAVGDEMNKHFVAVKVQMDTTAKDNASVKSWHRLAHSFIKDYHITGYPTYLIFDPSGKIVHKGLGKFEPLAFVQLLQDARNPDKQFYTQVRLFNKKKLSTDDLLQLLKQAKQFRDAKLASEVLNAYRKQYLDKLPSDSMLGPENISFINQHVQELVLIPGSVSPYFRLFYERGAAVDSVTGQPGYAAAVVNQVIDKEEIRALLYKGTTVIHHHPDWPAMKAGIYSKYPAADARLLVLNGQFLYYHMQKDWPKKIQALVEKMDRYGVFSEPELVDNKIVTTLLPYCTDTTILNKAVGWMEQLVNSDYYGKYAVAQAYGNYAAILYQAGQAKKAVQVMEQYLATHGYTEAKREEDHFKDKITLLEKMKAGEKVDESWPVKRFGF